VPTVPSQPRRYLILLAIAFPLVVWAFATLFHGGQMGPWNDDYFFNTRDPATGDIAGWAITSREPYQAATGQLSAWRPLLFTVITGVITLCWNHFWIAHVVGALLHAANVIVFFVLLRQLGRSLHTAAACASLFLCWAVHHEAWLWPSAYGSVTSALLAQIVVLLMLRYARGPEANGITSAPMPGPGRYWCIAAMMSLTLLILGFNEQATGILAALPFAYFAVCDTQEPTPRRLRRAALATAAVCLLPPLYVYVVRTTAQPGLGVNPDTYVPLTGLWPRFLQVVRDFAMTISMKNFWYPALALGWRAWTIKNYIFLPWLGLLIAASICSWRIWMRCRPTSPPQHIPPHPLSPAAARIVFQTPVRIWAVVFLGLGGAFGAMLPIAVIEGYPAHSRVTYIVLLMLLIAFACALDGIAAGVRQAFAHDWRAQRRFLSAAGVALLALMLFGGVMSVGTQERMRRTVAKDELNGQQLRALLPSPLPGTVFLPVTIRPPVFTVEQIVILHPWLTMQRLPRELDRLRPKVGGFHWPVRSVWEGLWSMKYFVKHVYARDDVWLLFAAEELTLIEDITPENVRFVWHFGTPYAQATDPQNKDPYDAVIPLEKVVPITFDADGNLLLVARLIVEDKQGTQVLREVAIPQVPSGATVRVRVGGGD